MALPDENKQKNQSQNQAAYSNEIVDDFFGLNNSQEQIADAEEAESSSGQNQEQEQEQKQNTVQPSEHEHYTEDEDPEYLDNDMLYEKFLAQEKEWERRKYDQDVMDDEVPEYIDNNMLYEKFLAQEKEWERRKYDQDVMDDEVPEYIDNNMLLRQRIEQQKKNLESQDYMDDEVPEYIDNNMIAEQIRARQDPLMNQQKLYEQNQYMRQNQYMAQQNQFMAQQNQYQPQNQYMAQQNQPQPEVKQPEVKQHAAAQVQESVQQQAQPNFFNYNASNSPTEVMLDNAMNSGAGTAQNDFSDQLSFVGDGKGYRYSGGIYQSTEESFSASGGVYEKPDLTYLDNFKIRGGIYEQPDPSHLRSNLSGGIYEQPDPSFMREGGIYDQGVQSFSASGGIYEQPDPNYLDNSANRSETGVILDNAFANGANMPQNGAMPDNNLGVEGPNLFDQLRNNLRNPQPAQAQNPVQQQGQPADFSDQLSFVGTGDRNAEPDYSDQLSFIGTGPNNARPDIQIEPRDHVELGANDPYISQTQVVLGNNLGGDFNSMKDNAIYQMHRNQLDLQQAQVRQNPQKNVEEDGIAGLDQQNFGDSQVEDSQLEGSQLPYTKIGNMLTGILNDSAMQPGKGGLSEFDSVVKAARDFKDLGAQNSLGDGETVHQGANTYLKAFDQYHKAYTELKNPSPEEQKRHELARSCRNTIQVFTAMAISEKSLDAFNEKRKENHEKPMNLQEFALYRMNLSKSMALQKTDSGKLDISNDNIINNNINDNIINNKASGFKRKKISFENLENKISINNGKHLKVSEKLRYTGDPKAPRLDDIKQLEWVKKLGEKAEKSKGVLSDSGAYLKFLKNAKIISDIAEQISKRKGLGMGDEAIIPTSNFAKDTKKMTGNNEVITVKQAKELYAETWGNLVKSAKAYEKYKLKDEGFTRDVNNKDKHQLKSRSKMKFELMDEIFEPQKRMAAAAKKDSVRL